MCIIKKFMNDLYKKIPFKFSLPKERPPFASIDVPHMGTRANDSGLPQNHTCILRDQNKFWRPKTNEMIKQSIVANA